MLYELIAQTGFDRGRNTLGFLFIMAVSIALLVFIFFGGLYMRNQELRAREMRKRRDDDARHNES